MRFPYQMPQKMDKKIPTLKKWGFQGKEGKPNVAKHVTTYIAGLLVLVASSLMSS